MRTKDNYIVGYPPIIRVGAGNPEAQKYGKLWEKKEYRAVAPGEIFVAYFMQQVRPKSERTLADYGCGTGRAGLRFAKEIGLQVHMFDFVGNCLDAQVRDALGATLTFTKHDLMNPIPIKTMYGYCTDVMEHIPTENVNRVLDNILRASNQCFFAICTKDDVCGELIGEPLHLTVQPFEWWQEKLQKELGAVIHWSEQIGSYAFFHVSIWTDAQTMVNRGSLNEAEDKVKDNIRFNCGQDYQQVTPHETNDFEAMIVGTGPTLEWFEHDIREKRGAGIKLITLNGAYNWCLERGITPSATVVVDSRENNAKFTKPVVKDVKYLLASQCHPSVFEGIPKEQVYLWHAMGDLMDPIVKEKYPVHWAIPGGSTVFLRAIPLMRTLGYRRFHVYGVDSCIIDGRHHSIVQKENDGQHIEPIMVDGQRIFYCNPWMAAQAREFVTLIQKIGETFDMIIYGDGLLAHILNTGATLDSEEE